MISVVCFKWAKAGYRSKFASENVNISARMVDRHFPEPHRFICVTDDPTGIDPGIEVVPLWDDHADLLNPTWPAGPNCFPRLKLWGRNAGRTFGNRIVQIDLDMVFTRDLRPMWNRPEPLLIWGTGNPRIPYCASMLMMDAGVMPEVWEKFDPLVSPSLANRAGHKGSDQGWISYCFGSQQIPTWTKDDGIYSYRDHVLKENRGKLFPNARVVVFHGRPDPWDQSAQVQTPWIKQHYQ